VKATFTDWIDKYFSNAGLELVQEFFDCKKQEKSK
jgi:hypothetical protein